MTRPLNTFCLGLLVLALAPSGHPAGSSAEVVAESPDATITIEPPGPAS